MQVGLVQISEKQTPSRFYTFIRGGTCEGKWAGAVRPQVKQGAREGWQKTPSLLCRLRGVWHVHWGALELKPAIRGGHVSQEWACSVSLWAGSGVVQATGSVALGQTEHWFQSPAAGLGQSHTLQLEMCQVHAHGRPVGGSLHLWFNSRWQLEANTESRLCSSVQILRRPLPPQITQLPCGHSNLSCGRVYDGGESFLYRSASVDFGALQKGSVLSMEGTQKYT